MRALRTERVQLIARLQNQHTLAAYRNDYELILLEFRRFIAGQMRWAGRPRLWQRFQVANDWVSNTDQPAEEARAQENVEKMTARCCQSRLGSFTHDRFFYPLVPRSARICSGGQACSDPRFR